MIQELILLQTHMHEKLRSSGRKYTKKGKRKEIKRIIIMFMKD
jgi:hypothetical protein